MPNKLPQSPRRLVHCQRCGWQWFPRNPKPVKCANPGCKSPYWNTPRKVKKEATP